MTIKDIIDKAEKESGKNLVNLTKTIAYATEETYVKAMNDIYKQVGTGKIDYFTAYKKIVDGLTKKGITLQTKDGREEKLEVAVRRGLFGSLYQTANEIAKQVGEDIDYNCVVIGHSYTCRPSHNVIDDVVMSKEEFKKYEHLTEEYGCNHVVNYDWREEFEGINNKKEYGPEHMDNEKCKRNYEIKQKARYYERMIREKKNIINRGDTSDKAKQELKQAQIKYRAHCSKHGLRVDYKRIWKSGYHKMKSPIRSDGFIQNIGNKTSIKEIEKYEEKIVDSTVENAIIIQENGDVYHFKGTNDYVKIPVNLNNAIVTHNHLSDDGIYRSFGHDDFNFLKNNAIKIMRIVTPNYIFEIKKIKDIDISYNEIYKEAMERVFFDNTLEIQHVTMLILKEKGYVEYERRVR